MRRHLPALLFCFLISPRLFAQVGQTLYFKNFRPTDDSTHADYYRVMTAQNGETFSYTEYYKDGSYLKATGKNGLASPVKVGEDRLFYKNGKLAILNRYSLHGAVLSTTGFYPNGVMMYVEFPSGPFPSFRLINYDADSSGHVHIMNGNGRRQEADSIEIPLYKIKERFIMEGPYKNGKKDGLWVGKFESGQQFEEEYSDGKLTSGTAKTEDGKKHHYTLRYQYPDFGENLDDFERRIISSLKNSNDSAGLVFIKPGYLRLTYTINEQGRIVNLKGIKKSNHTSVDIELKRPLPAIEPQRIRGVPVAFTVADNRDFMLRGNFKVSPFQTDVYLNGQYKPPAQ